MASCGEVHKALQEVSQRLQWTYALFWQLCPRQGALVWAEGHYNGAIKTRKTVQPAGPAPGEPAPDQAARHRSRQLHELFDSLAREAAAQGGLQEAAPARRPSAALSPEDLTETEWFYLMSASYSFPPGVGLPGRAFTRREHVWLTGANDVDSTAFSRAILAKSAGIQTVVCIPIVDGVLEMGTTEKVEEDIGLVQYAVSIFADQHDIQMMPTISEHSTSDQITHLDQQSLETQRNMHTIQTKVESNKFSQEYENNEIDDDYEIGAECTLGSETNTERNYCQHAPVNIVSHQATTNAESNELRHNEMPVRVRDGFQCNRDDEIQMLMVSQNSDNHSNFHGQEEPWHFLDDELCSGYPQLSATEDQAMTSPENAHYSQTVLSILHQNACRQANSKIKSYLVVSHQSSFSRWCANNQGGMLTEGTPQRMLKSILVNVASIDYRYREVQPPDLLDGEGERTGLGGSQRGAAVQGEFSANHVLQERKRREKLNERFIMLRSLVPFVTKMDKASILGDTIEYVKQLRRRIQDLESQARHIQGNMIWPSAISVEKSVQNNQHAATLCEKRKLRAVEGSTSTSSSSGTGKPSPVAAIVQHSTDIQVSIIESDALLELRCPYRRGLLVQIMQSLQELQLEISSVHSSSVDGVLLTELRAKVREAYGRRSSISEVKRAIHLIISSG